MNKILLLPIYASHASIACMTIFKKIKTITVGQLTTRYTVELVCARCNHFTDLVAEIKPPAIFNLTEITWALPHLCDLPKEMSKLNAESKYNKHESIALAAGKRRK